MINRIKIGKRYVGEGEPVLMVAEVSCNHLQKKEYAIRLIEEAKNAGVDAVKFQTYTPDTMTIDAKNEHFMIKGSLWDGRTLYDLYREAYTPWEWFPELKDRTEQEGMIFISSPFDDTAVDFLEKLGTPAYKVASFEINHIPLLKKIARTKKPVIFSTGLATLDDIQLAIETIKNEGNEQIGVLKCTSAYPAPVSEMNLRTIDEIRKRFGVVVGLSDHSMGIAAPATAVAFGASIIEKHIILDRKMGGPDAAFSLEPTEFKQLVDAVREVEQALGKLSFELTEKAKEHRIFMRSIFVVKDIKKGEIITPENIKVIRPNKGMHPKYYEGILGKPAKKDIKRGTPLSKEMVNGE
ncbi:pseudaminic acid synthase [Candidatus Micrarchaeota archaeon]|nr:pseudaminic acid synthase [Candidatus Micrarchaeota archaeon]